MLERFFVGAAGFEPTLLGFYRSGGHRELHYSESKNRFAPRFFIVFSFFKASLRDRHSSEYTKVHGIPLLVCLLQPLL